jgi:hypothetical protein
MRGLPDRSSAPFRSDDPEAPLCLRPSLLLRLRLFFFRAFFLRACSKQSTHTCQRADRSDPDWAATAGLRALAMTKQASGVGEASYWSCGVVGLGGRDG